MAQHRKPWQRTGEDKRIRGHAGQRLRKRRLARTNGLCERCQEHGRVRLATTVNHKIPLARDGLDIDENTENLCDECDAIVTAQQFGKRDPTAKGVDRKGRPTDPRHPWNSG